MVRKWFAVARTLSSLMPLVFAVACGQSAGQNALVVGDMLPLTVQTGSTSKIQIPVEVPEGERIRKATFTTKDDILPAQQLSGKSLNLVVPSGVSALNNQVTGIITVEDSKGNVTRKEFPITILKSSSGSSGSSGSSASDESVQVSN